MPTHDLDAVFFVEQGPTIEARGGMFHVCYTIGRCNLEVVLQPHVFLKALRLANRVAADFNSKQNVIPLREIDAGEADDEATGTGH